MANTMTPEQFSEYAVKRLSAHFTKVIGRRTPTCSVCQHEDWAITGLFSLYQFHKSKQLSEQVVPVITIICQHCSHILQFPWMTIGGGVLPGETDDGGSWKLMPPGGFLGE